MWIVSEKEDKYVASTWGAVVNLTAGVPRQVGHDMGLLCLQAGCTEVKEPSVAETPVTETPVVEEVVETPTDFNSMTKGELETYGRTIGIELDKRKKKIDLIAELYKAAE